MNDVDGEALLEQLQAFDRITKNSLSA